MLAKERWMCLRVETGHAVRAQHRGLDALKMISGTYFERNVCSLSGKDTFGHVRLCTETLTTSFSYSSRNSSTYRVSSTAFFLRNLDLGGILWILLILTDVCLYDPVQ